MMSGSQNALYPGNYPGRLPNQQGTMQANNTSNQNGLSDSSQLPVSKVTPGDSNVPMFSQFVPNTNSAFNPTLGKKATAPVASFAARSQVSSLPLSNFPPPYNMPNMPVLPSSSYVGTTQTQTAVNAFGTGSINAAPTISHNNALSSDGLTAQQYNSFRMPAAAQAFISASQPLVSLPTNPLTTPEAPSYQGVSSIPVVPMQGAMASTNSSQTGMRLGMVTAPISPNSYGIAPSHGSHPASKSSLTETSISAANATQMSFGISPSVPPTGLMQGMTGQSGVPVAHSILPPTPGMVQTSSMPPAPNMFQSASITSGISATSGLPQSCGMPPFPNISEASGMPHAPSMPSAPGMSMTPGIISSSGMPSARRGLSLDSMPSVVQVIEEDRSTRSGPFPTGFPNAEHTPLCTTDFFAQDQGNCSPKFMRSTLYVAPASSDILKNTQIPFAVAISPFASLSKQEARPPIIDLGEMGPVRCARCKAYMCPFMEFQDGGRRFKCAFCLATTKVEDGYFAHLDPSGRRSDIQHRPEQFLGSYDFVATKQYCKNGLKPLEPAFIFMLDVSYTAVHSGLVSIFCKNIRGLLDGLPRDVNETKSSIRIGFVTYDQTLHFYNLKNPLGQPKMTVVSDIQDVFTPLVDGFLVTLEEAESALESLLVEVEKMFADTRVTDTILGPVIQAGMDALRCADRAGKLFIFHTNLPTCEAPGKLKNRDDRKLLGTEKEKNILQPANDFYGKLGEECVKSGCAVDLFLFPNSFVDVASLGPVCTITGGSIYKYQYFEAHKDGERFLCDLAHDISREIVFDVMMRVRTSTGLRPTGFFGSFHMDNSTDMEMGTFDCDKAVHVEMRHDDKLPEGSAHIQCAVLFTSCSGKRRLRVHNLTLAVSGDYNQVYRVADHGALVSYLFKQAESIVRDKTPKEMRESVTARCAQMLATYRERCSEQAPLGQLILPECLKLLPLYGNCIIRNDAVSGGSDCTVDDRAWLMHMIPSLNVEDALRILYPLVYPITDLSLESLTDDFNFPGCIRASYEYFNPEKAYLVCNGVMVFIWIGLGVSQNWIQDVFNANSVTHLNTENHVVPERDNARSRALRRMIEDLKLSNTRSMKLFIIRQQDALEAWMKKSLVEDQSSNMPSYVDYLCTIHREIRSLLS